MLPASKSNTSTCHQVLTSVCALNNATRTTQRYANYTALRDPNQASLQHATENSHAHEPQGTRITPTLRYPELLVGALKSWYNNALELMQPHPSRVPDDHVEGGVTEVDAIVPHGTAQRCDRYVCTAVAEERCRLKCLHRHRADCSVTF